MRGGVVRIGEGISERIDAGIEQGLGAAARRIRRARSRAA
jgi:hypothetical protein